MTIPRGWENAFTIKWRRKEDVAKGNKQWYDWKFPAAREPMKWKTEEKMQAYCDRLRKQNPQYEFRETMWLGAFAV